MSPNQQEEQIHQDSATASEQSPNPITGMTQEEAWASHPEYLDTARLRKITYGNLVLRKKYHKFFQSGVFAAVAFFVSIWFGYIAYGYIATWVSGWGDDDAPVVSNRRVITSITELAPPPPMNENLPPPPPVAVAPQAPPDVGKVKKVKNEEAPREKTLATQKDIKKALMAGAQDNSGDTSGIGEGLVYAPPEEPVEMEEDPPMFVAVEKMPSFVNQIKPKYPEIAKRSGIEGLVVVNVLIGKDGRPIKAKIMKKKPKDSDIFDEAAVSALMGSSYSPGIQNGRPIKVWLTVPMRFKLN